MRIYICTLSRMRPLKLLCAAIALATLGLPMSAQQARTSGNTQAELHIRVIVVPVVAPHHDRKDRDRDEDSVAYNLAPRKEELSITEEVRPMLVNTQGQGAALQPVHLTTLVLK
ncbi:MAG TPA: hypothetical protein VGH51_20545 [Candidatus Angelobacter sp.]